ncbi:MAG: DUF6622 family protein [Sporomusaceae bacterium]|nr:DUF6622 family protein [Sporomusaceae bacterium]
MEKLLQALHYTPVWVYLLLACLVFAGVRAAKPRVVDVRRMAAGAAAFAVLSLYTVLSSAGGMLVAWAAGFTGGALFGWRQVCKLPAGKAQGRFCIRIPGSWSSLYTMLGLFAVNYYSGYKQATDPGFTLPTAYAIVLLPALGACTGLVAGRSGGYLFRLSKRRH